MKKILVTALITMTGSFALAAGGDAGCGLGSIVFEGKNQKLYQILAATTNGTFASQTFGITFGTSNCTSNGWTLNDKEQILFVEANLDRLKVDAARGGGETLAGLSQVLGCSSTEALNGVSQNNYSAIFTEGATAVEVLNNYKTAAPASCSRI